MRILGLGIPALALAWLVAGDASACPKGQKRETHEIVQGDSLSEIGAKYGMSLRELESENPGLRRDSILKLGRKVRVCVAPEEAAAKARAAAREAAKAAGEAPVKCGKGKVILDYKAVSGDTVGVVASRFGLREEDVVSRNAALKKDPDSLKAGQRLELCVDERRANAAPECNYETPIFEHVVVPGEDPSDIAGRYGVRSVDLFRWNRGLKDKAKRLHAGDKVKVCPAIAPRVRDKVIHKVVKGENLGVVALKYGLSPGELLTYQDGKVKKDDVLSIGQELIAWVDGAIAPGFGGEYDDDTGVLKKGVQLAPGPYYVVKAPANAWGTAKTVRLIQAAVAAYAKRAKKGPAVHVGDISKKGGGKFPPHRSHQHGRDVDVGYVLKGEVADEPRFLHAGRSNLDAERTWALLKAFIDTDEVRYIFMDYELQRLVYEHAKAAGESQDTLDELFQYPRGRGRSHGIIRHWKNHVNHFHVRFRE